MMRRIFTFLLVILLVLAIFGCMLIPRSNHKIFFFQESCIKPHDGYNYLTCHPIKVLIDKKKRTIPANFDTDLASIPRWYWSIASPNYSAFVAPAILHDYLYQCPNQYSRKTIDEIFYYALLENGAGRLMAYKMFVAVRLFGGSHYHGLSFCIPKNSKAKNAIEESIPQDIDCGLGHRELSHG